MLISHKQADTHGPEDTFLHVAVWVIMHTHVYAMTSVICCCLYMCVSQYVHISIHGFTSPLPVQGGAW